MTRINNLNMTFREIVIALSDSNPGAIRVIMELHAKTPLVDPDSMLGGLGSLLSLDTNKIYGSRIWVLYKDVCGESIVKTIGVLRAVQLGIINKHTLSNAIDIEGVSDFDVDIVLIKVRTALPAFSATDSVPETI